MKKKLKNLIICISVIVMFQPMTMSVIAGDESNPEITDDENDIIGPRGNIVTNERYNYLDIVSGWFFEKENEPDYLFASLKINNYGFRLNPMYFVNFNYGSYSYDVEFFNDILGILFARAGLVNWTEEPYEIQPISHDVDLRNSIITFKIPKELIDNPKKDDKITHTYAWTTLQYGFINYYILKDFYFIWQDRGPDEGYGKDYIIQY